MYILFYIISVAVCNLIEFTLNENPELIIAFCLFCEERT